MVAEGNRDLILKVFRELFTVRFFMVGICCFGLYFLSEPFINLWVGGEYILDHTTLILIIVLFFCNSIRSAVDIYVNAYGLFRDIWAPVAEAVIFAVSAIIFGRMYGLNGVLASAILELVLIVYIWRPYFLFRSGMGCSPGLYFMLFLKMLLCGAVAFVLADLLLGLASPDPGSGILPFCIYAVEGCGAFALIYFTLLYIAEEGMRTFLTRILNTLRCQQ